MAEFAEIADEIGPIIINAQGQHAGVPHALENGDAGLPHALENGGEAQGGLLPNPNGGLANQDAGPFLNAPQNAGLANAPNAPGGFLPNPNGGFANQDAGPFLNAPQNAGPANANAPGVANAPNAPVGDDVPLQMVLNEISVAIKNRIVAESTVTLPKFLTILQGARTRRGRKSVVDLLTERFEDLQDFRCMEYLRQLDLDGNITVDRLLDTENGAQRLFDLILAGENEIW